MVMFSIEKSVSKWIDDLWAHPSLRTWSLRHPEASTEELVQEDQCQEEPFSDQQVVPDGVATTKGEHSRPESELVAKDHGWREEHQQNQTTDQQGQLGRAIGKPA